jgi:hypothetical protein
MVTLADRSVVARRLLLFVTLTAVTTVLGCGLINTGCTASLASAIQVDVYDSVTRAIASRGSTVILQGAGLADTVMVPDSLAPQESLTATAHIWFEDRVKAGTYRVQVLKPGYRVWTRDGIGVRANRCHVTTFDLVTAYLQR